MGYGARQIAQAQAMTDIVCVQNLYNLAGQGIACLPCFPPGATPLQVALACLQQRASYILWIPGTASLAHLCENLAAAQLALPAQPRLALEWDLMGTARVAHRAGCGKGLRFRLSDA